MAIVFKDLGNQGRFGNCLFQASAAIGTASKQGYSCILPTAQGEWNHWKYFITPPQNTNMLMGIEATYYEPHFHYKEINVLDNTNLSGYFQSEKYFSHCKDEIHNTFCFKDEYVKPVFDKWKDVLNGDTCAIHVRRGDYVTNPNHLALDYKYYAKAMSLMKGKVFLIFSDDINYCKTVFRKNPIFVEGQTDIEDFILMTLCKSHIIANSSFSWWGAWLSGSKDIIAPYHWFGRGLKHHRTNDLIPDGWQRV